MAYDPLCNEHLDKSIQKYFGFHPECYFPVTWSPGIVSFFMNGSLMLGGAEPWGVIFGFFWSSDACKRCCILSWNKRRGSWPGKDGQLQLSLILSACKQRKDVLWHKQKTHHQHLPQKYVIPTKTSILPHLQFNIVGVDWELLWSIFFKCNTSTYFAHYQYF